MINTTYNPVTSKLKNGASSLVANVLCWALSITCIAPVIWMIYSSLKTDKEFALDILALPESPQWGNYVKAFIAYPHLCSVVTYFYRIQIHASC